MRIPQLASNRQSGNDMPAGSATGNQDPLTLRHTH
jgi:hypothetical protein